MDWIWIAVIAAAFILLCIPWKKRPSPVRRLFTCVYRWGKHRMNLAAIPTVALSIVVLIIVIMGTFSFYQGHAEMGFAEAVLHGVYTAFEIFEGDPDSLRCGWPDHRHITLVLSLAVPLLMVSTVFLFFLQAFSKPLIFARECFVFSHSDERSLLLAEDLAKNRRWARLIFLRTNRKEAAPDTLYRIKKLHAWSFPYTETELLEIRLLLKRKKLRFFFLSKDSDENFRQAEALLEDAEAKKLFLPPFCRKAAEKEEARSVFRQELYILSEDASASQLIDHLREETADGKARKEVFRHTELVLLDRYRTVTTQLLMEKPLYDYIDGGEVRVLVLGFGRVGQAFYRAAASMCAMKGVTASFCLCDRNIKEKEAAFLLQYPESKEGLSVTTDSCNAESDKLMELIERERFTYIMLSLGDDERNIVVANSLLRFYRKKHWEKKKLFQPVLCVNLENETKAEYIKTLSGKETQCASIHVFGPDHNTFSEELLNRGLWTAARALHKGLKREDSPLWREYERRSSIAAAAHCAYHVASVSEGPGGKCYRNIFKKLSDEEKGKLFDAEHRRWMHYSRCEGLQQISGDTARKIKAQTGNHMDPVALLSPCFVDSDQLDKLDKKLYGKRKAGDKTFRQRDEFVVRNAETLCAIIKDPNGDHPLT